MLVLIVLLLAGIAQAQNGTVCLGTRNIWNVLVAADSTAFAEKAQITNSVNLAIIYVRFAI